jgi:hypothetical protein
MLCEYKISQGVMLQKGVKIILRKFCEGACYPIEAVAAVSEGVVW